MSKEQAERINVLKSKSNLTEYERIELQVLSDKLYKPINYDKTYNNKPSFSVCCVEVGVKHPVK
jgi:hypothetical protein